MSVVTSSTRDILEKLFDGLLHATVTENIGLLLGVEFKTEFSDEFKLLPKIGIRINL